MHARDSVIDHSRKQNQKFFNSCTGGLDFSYIYTVQVVPEKMLLEPELI